MQFWETLEELEKEPGIYDIYMVRGSSSHHGMGMSKDPTSTLESCVSSPPLRIFQFTFLLSSRLG